MPYLSCLKFNAGPFKYFTVFNFIPLISGSAKDLASAFNKASQNTFSQSDAVKSVSDLKEAVRDSTKWMDAALKSFQFAKSVVSFLK